jgi:hypothetical protein
LLIAAVAGGSTIAHASTRTLSSPNAAPGGSQFCATAAAFGTTTTDLFALSPHALEAEGAKFKAAQPILLLSAPRALKHDLQTIFAFDTQLFNELSKVGWSIARIPWAEVAQWTITGLRLKSASDKVIGFLDTTCRLKLAKP